VNFVTNNSRLKWALVGALVLSSEYGASQAAVLLRSVNISRDTIRLSDLLPPNSSIAMGRAAEQIELGRTPQCHTIRLFEPPDIEKRTALWPVLQSLTLSGPVSVQRACFPIRRKAIQQVISEFVRNKEGNAGLVDPALIWSEGIYASQEDPVLEIVQAHPDPVRPALQIRLRCVERTVCPSFWVAVPTRQRPHFLFSAATTRATERSPALVKSGQRVMLIFDDSTLHIQLQAICLQRGSLGEQIRAMDSSTHRVFRAEVTGPGTLRAHL
jgi:hypothetical protein